MKLDVTIGLDVSLCSRIRQSHTRYIGSISEQFAFSTINMPSSCSSSVGLTKEHLVMLVGCPSAGVKDNENFPVDVIGNFS